MRRNFFGQTYCHTADEARRVIDNHENGWEVYVGGTISPPESTFGASVEVLENVTGDVVCYLEAPTKAKVKEMIAELKLEQE